MSHGSEHSGSGEERGSPANDLSALLGIAGKVRKQPSGNLSYTLEPSESVKERGKLSTAIPALLGIAEEDTVYSALSGGCLPNI